MKSLIISTLLIAFSAMNALSQDITGVWHGTAKNPDNKEVLFVFLFENTPNGLISTMAIPAFETTAKRNALHTHNELYLTPILKSLGATNENISKFIENETETVLRPWSKYFYNYNPANEFEKLNIPVLSLYGSKDQQVVASINQNAIRNALKKGNNDAYKVVELENLNHLFQECETGKIDEYKELEQTISPIVLEEISDWIFEIIQAK